MDALGYIDILKRKGIEEYKQKMIDYEMLLLIVHPEKPNEVFEQFERIIKDLNSYERW